MAARMTTKLETEWARVGAQARLAQIQDELDAIYKAFPELRRGRPGAPAPGVAPKRVFSRKGKEAISEGMRKYWARRKAAETKASKTAAKS